MTKSKTNILANRIASNAVAKLFTNGANEHAIRLQLKMEDERDGGGWNMKAAFDQIYDVVSEALMNTERVISAAEYVDESDLCPSHVPIYAVKAEAFRRLRDALETVAEKPSS